MVQLLKEALDEANENEIVGYYNHLRTTSNLLF